MKGWLYVLSIDGDILVTEATNINFVYENDGGNLTVDTNLICHHTEVLFKDSILVRGKKVDLWCMEYDSDHTDYTGEMMSIFLEERNDDLVKDILREDLEAELKEAEVNYNFAKNALENVSIRNYEE